MLRAILIVVLRRNVVLWDLASPHFALIGVRRVLHAFYDAGLKRLAFFN